MNNFSNKLSRGRPAGQRNEEAREALLASALKVFSKQGFEAASVRKIAADGGVDAALIRHYFGSKQGLWEEVVRSASLQLKAQSALVLKELAQHQGDTRKMLIIGLNQYIDFSASHPELAMFISNEAAVAGPRIDFIVEHVVRPSMTLFTPLINAGIAQGHIAKSDPRMLYFMLIHAIAMPLAFPGLINQFPGAQVGSKKFVEQLREAVLAIFILPEQ
jgi:TetR/AcrR family transcriptional regulator